MKKLLALLLVISLMLATACEQDRTAADSPPPASSSDAGAPSQAEEPTQSDIGSSIVFDPDATIEETVLVDESDVKITATSLKCTVSAVKLNLTLENNSDKDLSFYAGTLGYSRNSVNGYMVSSGYLNADVSAGKKTNETVSFNIDELTMLGITDIADIELGFHIEDDENNDYLEVGPCQLKTSAADSYDYAADTFRQAITDGGLATKFGFSLDFDFGGGQFDQKGVRVLSQALVTNMDGEQVLFVEVENASTDLISTVVANVTVNGLGIQSGNWSIDWVSPGKRQVVTINLSSMLSASYRSAFGLDEIREISYSLVLRDSDLDALTYPETISLSMPGGGNTYDTSGEELYQDGGIRVVSKGLVPDDSDYSDDVHLLLLVENGSSQELSFDVDYGTSSVNGYMTDFICYSRTIAPGGAAILDVKMPERYLEENGIDGLENITEVEFTLEIRNSSYKTIAEPAVTYRVGQ